MKTFKYDLVNLLIFILSSLYTSAIWIVSFVDEKNENTFNQVLLTASIFLVVLGSVFLFVLIIRALISMFSNVEKDN